MIDEKKIKYDIETLKKCMPVEVENQVETVADFRSALQTAINLMEQVLEVNSNVLSTMSYYQKLAIAKDYVKGEDVKKLCEQAYQEGIVNAHKHDMYSAKSCMDANIKTLNKFRRGQIKKGMLKKDSGLTN